MLDFQLIKIMIKVALAIGFLSVFGFALYFIAVMYTDYVKRKEEQYKRNEQFKKDKQDAILNAKKMGISSGNTMSFANTSASTITSMNNVSAYVTRTRSMDHGTFTATMDSAFLDEEKDTRDAK